MGGAPRLHPDLRLRRSGPRGLVHGLARLGHPPPAQPVLLGRGQRPRRRQPAVEHVGHPGGRRPGPGHLGLRPGRLDQRRARRWRPRCSAWACFAAIRPLVTWKAGAVSAALVYGYSAALDRFAAVRPRVGHHAGGPAVPLHHACTKSSSASSTRCVATGSSSPSSSSCNSSISPEVLVMCLMLAVVGLVAVALVGWRQAVPRAGHALPALALGAGLALVVLAYPIWFGLAGPQAVTGVLFVIAPLTGVPFSGVALTRPVPHVGQRLRPHWGLPRPHRATAGLRRRRRRGGPGGRRAGPPARPDLAARPADRGDARPELRALPDRRSRLAGARLVALARPGHPARAQGDPARPDGSPHHPLPGLPLGPGPRCDLRDASPPRVVAVPAPRRDRGRRHRRPGPRGGGPRRGHLRRAHHGDAGRHSALPAPAGTRAACGHGAAHHPLRRLGLLRADVVAGRRGHALPAGRRRAQDSQPAGRARRPGRTRHRPAGS